MHDDSHPWGLATWTLCGPEAPEMSLSFMTDQSPLLPGRKAGFSPGDIRIDAQLH